MKAPYIALILTFILIIVPLYILEKNGHTHTQMHLRPICLAHQNPEWNICASCFERSDDKFIGGRGLVVEDTNSFLLWEIPGSQKLSCEQVLQFVDFQKCKERDSRIVFQQSYIFQQLSEKLQIKKHQNSLSKIQLSADVSHFAAFELGPEWNAGISVRQLSKESLQFLKSFTIVACSIGLSFFAVYFVYLIVARGELRLQLMLNISVLLMLIGFWTYPEQNYYFLLNYAIGLYICLCLMKIQSQKSLSLLILVIFIFFDNPEIKMVAILAGTLGFYWKISEKKANEANAKYLGTCLLIFTINQALKMFYFREQKNNTLCEIVENMILLCSPIMIEIIGAMQIQDIRELVVSKDAENKEKGFQKLTDLEEAESEQITTD